MSLTPLDKLDEARILARDLQAQLEAAKALLQARECGREERLPNSPALELSSREAYGFGLMLGLLADQLGKLEADLGQTQKALFKQAG